MHLQLNLGNPFEAFVMSNHFSGFCLSRSLQTAQSLDILTINPICIGGWIIFNATVCEGALVFHWPWNVAIGSWARDQTLPARSLQHGILSLLTINLNKSARIKGPQWFVCRISWITAHTCLRKVLNMLLAHEWFLRPYYPLTVLILVWWSMSLV